MTIDTCPEPGVWRAWLDREAQTPELESHLDACPACQQTLAELRETSAVAATAFGALQPARLPTPAELALARERLDWRRGAAAVGGVPVWATPARERTPMFLSRIPTPWRVAASGIAAVLLLSAVTAFSPDARTAAASFLAQFRPQQVAGVGVSAASQADVMRTMNQLGKLGTVEMNGQSAGSRAGVAKPGVESAHQSATAAEAAKAIGVDNLATPDPAKLPPGIDKTPRVQIMPANKIRFTFSKTQAAEYFKSTGHSEVSLPDKFDGATLAVSIPAAAILEYSSKDSGQALIVGQAGQLDVTIEGGKVSLLEMRDFLLHLPGLPAELTSQLSRIDSWTDTIPIPIPTDRVTWTETTINGSKALLLDDNSGAGSAAIWQAGGRLYGVAGSIKSKELQVVAQSLH